MIKDTMKTSLKSLLSLDPLFEFWEQHLLPDCSRMASMYADLKDQIDKKPDLKGTIPDMRVLHEHHHILRPLMSVIFPSSTFEKDIAGAVTPFFAKPFFTTPKFHELFIKNQQFVKGKMKEDQDVEIGEHRLLRVYFLILDSIYGIRQGLDTQMVRVVPDNKSGLDKYYRMTPDFQFIKVKTAGEARELSESEITDIIDNITDIEVLKKYIDLKNFEFHGFGVIRAIDVTQSEVISLLEKVLIDQNSIFSSDGIMKLEKLVRTLFHNAEINISIGASKSDRIMIVKSDCSSKIHCLFSNSFHVSREDIKNSVWDKAISQDSVIRIADLKKIPNPCTLEKQAVAAGVRSLLLAPLIYQGETIGCLELFTGKPYDLGAVDSMLLKQIAPIFSVALKRGLDEMDKSVQGIIKEKCTAVHPSVEWRFEKAAFSHMERLRQGAVSEMEPIIFKNVIPFFGQSDVRGSSLERNRGIQKDLIKQLNLAHRIMELGAEQRPWPLLKEYTYRIENMIKEISVSVNSGDEGRIFNFLNKEVELTFDELMNSGSSVMQAIENYRDAIDPVAGVIYEKRKDYEQSVSTLNETLSRYLDQEDNKIQESFPHYFEKKQTDGVDYMMYIGQSMMKEGKLSDFHIRNLTLWQIQMAAGLAIETEKIKSRLKVPLNITHLILINHKPLSIRFRYDEKRFDVDGAYDIRQEIIKSRLDKAVVMGSGERLTQPDKIALVYTNPEEESEIMEHISFLSGLGYLNDDLEHLDLDDMPEVRGLKALRISINLKSRTNDNIIEMRAG